MGPGPDFHERLLDALLDIPALSDETTGPPSRTMLLLRLPAGPTAAIARYPAPLADLNSIVRNAAGMGQLLDSGEWAVAIVTRNALRFARGAKAEKLLTALLAELEISATLQPAPIPEIVIGQDERLPIRFLERGMEASRSVAKVIINRILAGKVQSASGGRVSGTGWMIAPGMLMTNHHVIEARDRRFEAPASDSDFLARLGRRRFGSDTTRMRQSTTITVAGKSSMPTESSTMPCYALHRLRTVRERLSRIGVISRWSRTGLNSPGALA